MLVTWLAVARAADGPSATCAVRPDLARISDILTSLEASWTALDEAGFRKGADELQFLLPCATEVLSPAVAARTHRAFGLDAWVQGRGDQAAEALASAAALDPSWVAPDGWIADALVLRVAGVPATAEPSRVRRPHDGVLAFDGAVGRDRPAAPSVMQWVASDGTLLGSWYLLRQDPLPDYDPVYHSRRNLLATSLTSLAVGGALYGTAFVSAAAFERSDDPDRLHGLQTRTNALTAGGIALCALGGSGVGVALAVGR